MSLLQHYRNFVKQHPAFVLNAERLLHYLTYWTPERFESSEYTYEALSAAVGLLGIYNESILADTPDYNGQVAKWALWLAAVEQIQTLVELRAIQLEQRGKMSRYGPLMVLELLKALLRLQLWRSSKCTLALESVSREDQEQHECEQQLKELMQAFTRLRERYNFEPMANPTAEQLRWQQQLQREQMVRAAAIAPNRPPAACAAGELARHASLGTHSSLGSTGSSSSSENSSVIGAASNDSSRFAGRCGDCGAQLAAAAEQQQPCSNCGSKAPLPQQQQQPHAHGGASRQPAGIPAASTAASAASVKEVSARQSGIKLDKGWWKRISSLYPGRSGCPTESGSGRDAAQQQQAAPAACVTPTPAAGAAAAAAGALPGSWGPGSKEPYSKLPAGTPRHCHVSSSNGSGRSAAQFSFHCCKKQQQQQQLLQLQHNPWCLSNRDDSIGHSVMWLGELVHLLRPLLYVTLLKRYGLRSWKPWVLSLGLDLASGYGLHTGRAILTHSNASRWPPGSTLYSLALLRSLSSNRWSPGEQAELLGRRVQLLRYLLRSPCYDAVTRRLLQKVVSGSRWLPGLSNLAEFAFSMIEGMQSYYTYVEC